MLSEKLTWTNLNQFKSLGCAASRTGELRHLAELSNRLFASRRQTVVKYSVNDDHATIEMGYEGVLAFELHNGMTAGEILRHRGRSESPFRNGKIYRITDVF